jgi:dephospho-CoA kinase
MKNILSINDYILLNESINDKNLLKFIFVVGGAGSGKSYIAKNMFPDGRCKFYNTDILLEYYSKVEKFPLDYDNATPEEKKLIKFYSGLSKNVYERKSYHWLNGMLPIISDGTGMKSEFIIDLKNKYEDLGYDCYMIFVNTTKETSVERNRKIDIDKAMEEALERDPKVDKLIKRMVASNNHLTVIAQTT